MPNSIAVAKSKLGDLSIRAMNSTALEFDDDIVQSTDPLLIEIFQRIERGETTHEEEEQRLLDNYRKYGTIHV